MCHAWKILREPWKENQAQNTNEFFFFLLYGSLFILWRVRLFAQGLKKFHKYSRTPLMYFSGGHSKNMHYLEIVPNNGFGMGSISDIAIYFLYGSEPALN